MTAVTSDAKVEATTGFEPVNRGFADSRTTHVHTPSRTQTDADRPSPTTTHIKATARSAAALRTIATDLWVALQVIFWLFTAGAIAGIPVLGFRMVAGL